MCIYLNSVPQVGDAVRHGRTYLGIHQGDSSAAFLRSLVKLYETGNFPIDSLVRSYPPEEMGQAIHDM
jgi:Zn-dependent alcohol dehydrogenase